MMRQALHAVAVCSDINRPMAPILAVARLDLVVRQPAAECRARSVGSIVTVL